MWIIIIIACLATGVAFGAAYRNFAINSMRQEGLPGIEEEYFDEEEEAGIAARRRLSAARRRRSRRRRRGSFPTFYGAGPKDAASTIYEIINDIKESWGDYVSDSVDKEAERMEREQEDNR